MLRRLFSGRKQETVKDWQCHVDGKFKQYERLWAAAHTKWKEAHRNGDQQGMLTAFEDEGLYLRAEQLAHRDMSLPRDQWDACRDVDYVAEARLSLSQSGSYSDRIDAVERIMSQTPRQ